MYLVTDPRLLLIRYFLLPLKPLSVVIKSIVLDNDASDFFFLYIYINLWCYRNKWIMKNLVGTYIVWIKKKKNHDGFFYNTEHIFV